MRSLDLRRGAQGTGKVICPHCHGTKALRKRPAVWVKDKKYFGDLGLPHYPCYHCGDTTTSDSFDYENVRPRSPCHMES